MHMPICYIFIFISLENGAVWTDVSWEVTVWITRNTVWCKHPVCLVSKCYVSECTVLRYLKI